MTKPLGRRSFMRALAMAPVALKEAAGKLGLQGALGGEAWGMHIAAEGMPVEQLPGGPGSWAQRMVRNFWAPRVVENRMHSAASEARRLDPDLAALRSMSPAVAFTLQRQRCYERGSRLYLANLKQQIADQAYDRLAQAVKPAR